MAAHPYPEIPCTICSKLVDLRVDLYADENGRAVHEKCYINLTQSAKQPQALLRWLSE
jgi:hypothetical protein